MADGGEDTGDTITLRVKDQTGDEMFFKVKKNTKMQVRLMMRISGQLLKRHHIHFMTFLLTWSIFVQKIFDAFAQRKGIGAGSLRFMLDGERLKGEQTPKMLELEENDQIDVTLEMTGGSSEAAGHSDTVSVCIRDQTGDGILFKVKKITRFKTIFEAFAGKRGIPSRAIRFMRDGERITPDQTPKSIDLEDYEQIDAFIETIGGGGVASGGNLFWLMI